MVRGKKIEFTLKKIFIEFHCSKCDKDQKVEVDEYAFSFGESPCELCGSHGNLSVDVKCPDCKNLRGLDIKSW